MAIFTQRYVAMKTDRIPLTDKKYYLLFGFLTTIFLMWGLALTLMDVLNKHFQTALHISKSRSALIQLATFGAYTLVALPAGIYMKRFGYRKAILAGLFLFSIGAFLFIPAANRGSFEYFLMALFILASGMAALETVAHPYVAALGDQRTSDQRINFAQSFNGLGGVIGPAIGSFFLLKAEQQHLSDLSTVKTLYVAIGCVIALMGLVFVFSPFSSTSLPQEAAHPQTGERSGAMQLAAPASVRHLIHEKHFVFSVVAQFFNVAAQAGTWAYFINYGEEVLHLSAEHAGYFFSLSIFLLVIGRFTGTFLMRYIKPHKLLAIFAFCNILMCMIVAQSAGWVSFAALLMINFFFSIMYPTIFSLGLKDLGSCTQQASSFIVMGFLGGAIFPPLMGLIANRHMAASYYLPILCYITIFAFGIRYPRLNKHYRTLHKVDHTPKN
ncbi:L-fucose:H+ symporter permease [Arachidicoccus terrestris]|uniref:L-fucose:H+ symporter permease n=1 Tax=Arachidicoccus terrestris TaxID=2875539 RepID=UPI001CC64A37|nr:L-fucose:H+ symporter permease [Arachidicoccus terrestris]UAY55290.1 L-fucose:H+ symporter permease [Arachidicoccus terrestris]